MATKTSNSNDFIDFIDTQRMRNRNIRLTVHIEEGLLRACDVDNRNVSEEIRMILSGKAPNLVERGFLCATCLQTDCQVHGKPKPAPRSRKSAAVG